KIALMRLASVSQCAVVIAVLLTLATCSTFTVATCAISGTERTRSSPRIAPALYSARLVEVAPRPEIVPPVDSTQTTGRACGAPCPAHGALQAPTNAAANAKSRGLVMGSIPGLIRHENTKTRKGTVLQVGFFRAFVLSWLSLRFLGGRQKKGPGMHARPSNAPPMARLVRTRTWRPSAPGAGSRRRRAGS